MHVYENESLLTHCIPKKHKTINAWKHMHKTVEEKTAKERWMK